MLTTKLQANDLRGKAHKESNFVSFSFIIFFQKDVLPGFFQIHVVANENIQSLTENYFLFFSLVYKRY